SRVCGHCESSPAVWVGRTSRSHRKCPRPSRTCSKHWKNRRFGPQRRVTKVVQLRKESHESHPFGGCPPRHRHRNVRVFGPARRVCGIRRWERFGFGGLRGGGLRRG